MMKICIAIAVAIILLEFVAFLVWLHHEPLHQHDDTPLDEEPPRDQTRYWYILKDKGEL